LPHLLMTVSERTEMFLHVELFLRSLHLFNPPEEFPLSLVITTGRCSDTLRLSKKFPASISRQFPYIAEHAELFTANADFVDHPPVRWLIEPKCDQVVFVDADMLVCRSLDGVVAKDRAYGVLAHRNPLSEETWRRLFAGRGIEYPSETYLPLQNQTQEKCPWYVNYGFVAFPRDYFCSICEEMPRYIEWVMEKTANSYFTGQIALTLCVYGSNLKLGLLPLRFNYPDSIESPVVDYDLLYPEEMNETYLYHYLGFMRSVLSNRRSVKKFLKSSGGLPNHAIAKRVLETIYKEA
jgi:hypothetical protein